jgi:hypothetical protein
MAWNPRGGLRRYGLLSFPSGFSATAKAAHRRGRRTTLALAGRHDDAIREARRATELEPVEKSPWFGMEMF